MTIDTYNQLGPGSTSRPNNAACWLWSSGSKLSLPFSTTRTMSKRAKAEADVVVGGDNEAIRLKTLAEEKYENSDFNSALKYAKRAQRLDPNLGGLTEMVTALIILRAAEDKSDALGSLDWYKILQLEPFSNVDVVKKRYKNLALVLHPDKTSFVGCGDAFKLVGDAFRCLVSVERRKEFDSKLRVRIQDEALKKGEDEEVVERFRSRCDGCRMICKFERKFIGQSLMCSGCRKSFVALEVERSDDSDVTLSDEDTDGDDNVGGEEKGAAGEVSGADVGVIGGMKKGRESIIVYSRRKLSDARGDRSGVHADKSGEEVRSERLREKRINVVGEEMTLAELQLEAKKRKKSAGKNTMRKAMGSKPFEKQELRGNVLRNQSRKHSKTNDTNTEENDSETEMISLSAFKKKKVDVSKAKKVPSKSRQDEGSVENDHLEDGNFEVMTVEDSDFYDFDKDRVEKSFKQGHVWAIYDDKDGMPRHYGLINQVISTNPFEINMSWLELQTNNDDISNFTGSESYVSCGRFKVDKQTVINSVNFFSHIVNFDRAAREIYSIYPKKGSVWALYNEDSINQNGGECLQSRDERHFSIVIFLTSYSEMHGLSMAYLDKVNGFKTLFKRQQIGARAVIWMEKVNVGLFSHQIPARKLSEAEGLMFKDCWELDPAALPQSFLKKGNGS